LSALSKAATSRRTQKARAGEDQFFVARAFDL
jgi:hypothetical protein